MLGIEVQLNGGKLCTAGIGTEASLNAVVDVVGHDSKYQLTLRVGAFENDEFLIWSDRKLRIGDEIHIRIVETTLVDAPKRRKPNATKET
jgi:hypothetical protein